MIQTEPEYYEGPLKFISILCHRIWLEAKRIFAKIRGDAVIIDKNEAEKIAREIALGFMSDNFEGSVENAIKQRETLFSSIGTANIRAFRTICNNVQLMIDNFRVVLSPEDFRKNDAVAAAMEALKQKNLLDDPDVRNGTIFGNTMAIGGIVSMLVQLMPLVEQFGVVEQYINEIEYDMVDNLNFTEVLKENADKLRILKAVAENFAVITSELSNYLNPKSVTRITGAENGVNVMDCDWNTRTVDLMTLMFGEEENGKRKNDGLLRMTQDLKTRVANLEQVIFCRYLEEMYGSSYVQRAGHIVIVRQFSKKDVKSFWRMLFASMYNNPDVISQLADKAAKKQNFAADRKTNYARAWDMLRGIFTSKGFSIFIKIMTIIIVLIILIILLALLFPAVLICGYLCIVLYVIIMPRYSKTKKRIVKFRCIILSILSVLGFLSTPYLCDLFSSWVEKITGFDLNSYWEVL